MPKSLANTPFPLVFTGSSAMNAKAFRCGKLEGISAQGVRQFGGKLEHVIRTGVESALFVLFGFQLVAEDCELRRRRTSDVKVIDASFSAVVVHRPDRLAAHIPTHNAVHNVFFDGTGNRLAGRRNRGHALGFRKHEVFRLEQSPAGRQVGHPVFYIRWFNIGLHLNQTERAEHVGFSQSPRCDPTQGYTHHRPPVT
ncbi:MAG TPA: hypothetical protein VMU59_09120 [Caulobacteraceae bacterium]|nr:hypothetical protein [Caulobacteraceae bacterium]